MVIFWASLYLTDNYILECLDVTQVAAYIVFEAPTRFPRAVLVVLTSVLSAVGIRERSSCGGMEGGSGGVYSLVAHVLGGRAGGAVGLVYCFGQVR